MNSHGMVMRFVCGIARRRQSKALASAHGIHHAGVLGNGFTPVDIITTQLTLAVDGADVLLVCLPTLAHAALARSLIDANIMHIPTILNPGHTGGALEFSQVFRQRGLAPPPVAEFSTLTYVARMRSPGNWSSRGVPSLYASPQCPVARARSRRRFRSMIVLDRSPTFW